jgi:hypothetical protein
MQPETAIVSNTGRQIVVGGAAYRALLNKDYIVHDTPCGKVMLSPVFSRATVSTTLTPCVHKPFCDLDQKNCCYCADRTIVAIRYEDGKGCVVIPRDTYYCVGCRKIRFQ